MGGEAAGVLVLSLAEGLLIVPVAGAQDDHLYVHTHNLVDGGGDQVEALVPHQAGHAGDDGGVRVLPQAGHLLQGGFAVLLARHLPRREELGQALVPPGVIHLGVDAVEDAAQLVAVVGDNPLQAMGIEGVLELVGVGGGDGGHVVGGIDSPFHQIHVSVVGQHVLVEVPVVEPEHILQSLAAVSALVLDVVDGEHALGVAELGDAVALLQQIDGHQGGLPVVAVEHVWMPVQPAHALHHSPGEVGEALAIVVVAVNVGTLEVVFVVHKPVGDAVPLQLKDAAVGAAPGQGDVEALEVGHLTAPFLADAFVEGEDHPHVMAVSGQRLGQSAGHVGQSAGLDEGRTLRGGK